MKMLQEFKEFAMKGNVVDLAVGVVIGAAFGKIVASLVEDIMMPLVGWIVGKVDFSQLVVHLPSLIAGQSSVVVKYGVFLTVLVNFLIVAAAIFFFVIKPLSKMKKPAAKTKPGPTDIEILTEIRDLLKKNQKV
jgi:large conductance mechanosensitive channel